MNKFFFNYIFFFIILHCSVMGHTTPSDFENTLGEEEKKFVKQNIITIGVENWEPIIYSDGLNDINGISADFIKHIMADFNVKAKYVVKPWHELLDDFKNKKIDILPATYYTKNRAQHGLFSTSYFKVKEYLFVNQNNTTISGFKDLENKKIAIVNAYGTIEKVKKLFPSIEIIQTKDIHDSISLLLENKVDAIFESQFVVNSYLNNNVISGVKAITQNSFPSSNIHLYINMNKPIVYSIFQKGLNTIDQKVQNTILSKWIGEKKYIQKPLLFTKEERKYLQKKKELTICIKKKWFPYEGIQHNQISGIGGEYLLAIQEVTGIKYKIYNPKEEDYTKEFIKKYNCDIKPLRMKSYMTHHTYFTASNSYLTDHLTLITKIDEPFVNDIMNLKDKVFLINKNSHGVVMLVKNKFPTLKIQLVSSRQKGLSMIRDGKAFGFLTLSLIAFHDIQKKYASSLKIMNHLGTTTFGIAVRSDDTILLNIINKVLGTIEEEKKIAILNKWISIAKEVEKDFTNIYHMIFIAIFIYLVILYRHKLLLKQNIQLQKTINDATVDLRQKNKHYLNSIKNFQYLFDTTIEAIFLHDKDGKIVMVNKSGIEMAGFETMYDILGKNIYDFIPNYEMKKVEKVFKMKQTKLFEMDLYKRNHTIFPALVSGRDIIKDGKSLRLNTVVDLTELKRKDKLIQEQSKLALMGEMIGMIAHQWRQPLNVIGAINMKVETKLEFGESLDAESYKPISKDIVTQLEFMSKTIDDFRDFFKPATGKKKTSFHQILNLVLSMIEVLIENKGIKLEIDVQSQSTFESFENELTQVLLNLINNSIDALIDNCIENPFIKISIFEKNGKYILKLEDNAGGIPISIINHIFEPYFSTKKEKHGTGLGLYMSKVIVEEHCKGELSVVNTEKGIIFNIILNKKKKDND